MPHTHSVSIVFFIGAGSCYEANAEAGISHFVEHLCFKGTKKRRTPKEISEAIEGVGGIINGGTDKEITSFWCKVTSQHFFLALDVLIDLLRNSRFDAKDIDRERQVIIEEINMNLDTPQCRVDMLIDELLWAGQPLGRDIAGSKDTVAAITQQQMLDFFSQYYLPNNIVVSIAGNIEHDDIQDAIHQALDDSRPGDKPVHLTNGRKMNTGRLNIEFRDTKQAHLCLGVPGVSLFHPDRYTIDLLNVILGSGMSSRLFTEVREQQGLAYDIHSHADHFTDSGAIIVHAGVDPRRISNAVAAIISQLLQLQENISQAELNKAKELIKGRLLLGMENNQNVASWAGAQEMLSNRILTIEEVTSIVEATTIEDIRRVAQQFMTNEEINLAVVVSVKARESPAKLLKL